MTRRPHRIPPIGVVAAVLLAVIIVSRADEIKPADPPPALVPEKNVQRDGDTVRLPGLTIHAKTPAFIEATGTLALTNGILEFAAVETTGRTYESLIALDCKPSALQFALLLIGCQPAENPRQAQPGPKMGDRLDVEVEWELDGKTTRAPIEQLLVNRKTAKPPRDLAWYFTGSYFVKDFAGDPVFYADVDRSMIALLWMPGVLINLAGNYGNPYEGADLGFEAHTERVPPEGTPVKLILRKHRERR